MWLSPGYFNIHAVRHVALYGDRDTLDVRLTPVDSNTSGRKLVSYVYHNSAIIRRWLGYACGEQRRLTVELQHDGEILFNTRSAGR